MGKADAFEYLVKIANEKFEAKIQFLQRAVTDFKQLFLELELLWNGAAQHQISSRDEKLQEIYNKFLEKTKEAMTHVMVDEGMFVVFEEDITTAYRSIPLKQRSKYSKQYEDIMKKIKELKKLTQAIRDGISQFVYFDWKSNNQEDIAKLMGEDRGQTERK